MTEESYEPEIVVKSETFTDDEGWTFTKTESMPDEVFDEVNRGENPDTGRGLGPITTGIDFGDVPYGDPGSYWESKGATAESPTEPGSVRDTEGEDEVGVYGRDIVSVRMNSGGDVMDKEYAVGLIIRTDGDRHPKPEIVSDWVSDRDAVVKAIAAQDTSDFTDASNVVLYRYVSEPKVEGV